MRRWVMATTALVSLAAGVGAATPAPREEEPGTQESTNLETERPIPSAIPFGGLELPPSVPASAGKPVQIDPAHEAVAPDLEINLDPFGGSSGSSGSADSSSPEADSSSAETDGGGDEGASTDDDSGGASTEPAPEGASPSGGISTTEPLRENEETLVDPATLSAGDEEQAGANEGERDGGAGRHVGEPERLAGAARPDPAGFMERGGSGGAAGPSAEATLRLQMKPAQHEGGEGGGGVAGGGGGSPPGAPEESVEYEVTSWTRREGAREVSVKVTRREGKGLGMEELARAEIHDVTEGASTSTSMTTTSSCAHRGATELDYGPYGDEFYDGTNDDFVPFDSDGDLTTHYVESSAATVHTPATDDEHTTCNP